MKETFYFSHDYHARDDEKITRMIQKCGIEGYGIFWMLVEKLYEEGGLLDKDYDALAFALRTDSERIAKVVESGLFEFRNEKFYSKSVNARLIKRKGKSEMARQSANLRWSKPKKENANAMRTQCDGNAIKESKVKESKSISKDIEAEPLKNEVVVKEKYGRPDINKLLEDFETIMGFKSSSSKDRIFATHLLKNFNQEQLTAMIKYCSEDSYAPRVGSLEKLWFKRGDVIAGIKAKFNKQPTNLDNLK